MAEPLIRITNLRKTFDGFPAVDGVSLDIQRGELFAILGGSGCGKSTLLRLMAGFETPTSGQVVIDGVDMAGLPPFERPTNMMFQSYALFPHYSVADNVAYGLRKEGLGKADIKDRVAELLELVQLQDLARRKPRQLSGGQQQRVALARALAKRPKVLLLDEPLAALDKNLRERTQFELMNIQDRLGITFIVVTHDQEEAMTLATRIAVMDAGRFVQVGTPVEILTNPADDYVRAFTQDAPVVKVLQACSVMRPLGETEIDPGWVSVSLTTPLETALPHLLGSTDPVLVCDEQEAPVGLLHADEVAGVISPDRR